MCEKFHQSRNERVTELSPYDAVANVASSLALSILNERFMRGEPIEIPSLGIVIEQNEVREDAPESGGHISI